MIKLASGKEIILRIYEINTRVHCQSFDQISKNELAAINNLGFDAIWLMGIWQISEGARRVSKIVSDEFDGSPYAVPSYKFNRELGGKGAFASLVKRAHSARLKVIVDFVSNHMAIDSPWIDKHPEFFIRSNPAARKQSTADFFLHPSGEVIAFGRDPYFPPWHDTAQLNYTNAKLRARMIETLRWISQHADGVRCDMAMLVMRDYIRKQWYPLAPAAWFDAKMPGEFWDEAISAVKKERPDFIFIAEAYWDKEQDLIKLGFDLAYEKKLYDGLIHHNSKQVIERLARPESELRSSLYFIENHDEPRAASVFTRSNNVAATALMLSLPGSSLIYEGQMEGKRERLPVQRIKPLTEETPDLALKESYEQILKVTSDSVFKGGSFIPFDTGSRGIVSFIRQTDERTIAYIGQVGEASTRFNSLLLDISPLAKAARAQKHLLVKNLLSQSSIIIEESGGAFRILLNHLGVDDETAFCLLEATAPK